MSEKLLPCPFCGAPADPPELYGESKTAMFIACSGCGANIYHGTADKEANRVAAIAAWNRRVPPPPDRGIVEALIRAADDVVELAEMDEEDRACTDLWMALQIYKAAKDNLSTASQPQPERLSMVVTEREDQFARSNVPRMRRALKYVAYHYDLNDCEKCDQEGNLEMPLSVLRECKDALELLPASPSVQTLQGEE